jgi:hypothetical protein
MVRRNSNGEVLPPAEYDPRSYDERQMAGPTVAHPAQADNLPTSQALTLLERCVDALTEVANTLEHSRPRPAMRAAMRRRLSGVLADVETVRVSIRE